VRAALPAPNRRLKSTTEVVDGKPLKRCLEFALLRHAAQAPGVSRVFSRSHENRPPAMDHRDFVLFERRYGAHVTARS
jgi:hypothetical protein